MSKFKEHPFMTFFAAVCIVGGLYLIFGNPDFIKNTLSFLIGGFLIISGLSKLLIGSYYINGVKYEQKYSIILLDCILGTIIIFNIDFLVEIISFLYFILFPLSLIISNTNKKEEFMRQLPKIIIGVVVLFIELSYIYRIFLTIVGSCLILLGLVLIYLIIKSMTYNPFEEEHFYHNRLDRDDIINVRCDDEQEK